MLQSARKIYLLNTDVFIYISYLESIYHNPKMELIDKTRKDISNYSINYATEDECEGCSYSGKSKSLNVANKAIWYSCSHLLRLDSVE